MSERASRSSLLPAFRFTSQDASDAVLTAKNNGIEWDELFRLILESALKRSHHKPRNAAFGS